MSIEFRCETCGKLLRTADSNALRSATCPGCGDVLTVPTAGTEPVFVDAAGHQEVESAAPRRRPMESVVDRVPERRLADHRGGLILALGILSWCVCGVLGIFAWILGAQDLKEIQEGRMDPSGESLTRAGLLVGKIHVIVMVVMFLIGIVFVFSSVVLEAIN